MKEIIFCAVGDVGPNRKDPDSMFQHVHHVVKQADIAFCQLEPVLSRRGTPLPQARLPMRTDPVVALSLKKAGFHVISFATNHCLDWGYEAFLDTLETLRKEGLHVIGAGKNITEARRPAFFQCKDTIIAFLAYNSILPEGYWALPDRPGCAPLRAHTLYQPIEHDQPGTPANIYTYLHQEDREQMVRDIRQAKRDADVVIVSIHWGIHFIPEVLADYQREAAYAAIDAGADLILGHHPHILKGIETYKGKVVFYSLANFALESPFKFAENLMNQHSHQVIANLSPNWDPKRTALPPDSFKTIVVKCRIWKKKIQRVSFLPAYLRKECEPEILSRSDPRFWEVVDYVRDISHSQGLDLCLQMDGDEVTVRHM